MRCNFQTSVIRRLSVNVPVESFVVTGLTVEDVDVFWEVAVDWELDGDKFVPAASVIVVVVVTTGADFLPVIAFTITRVVAVGPPFEPPPPPLALPLLLPLDVEVADDDDCADAGWSTCSILTLIALFTVILSISAEAVAVTAATTAVGLLFVDALLLLLLLALLSDIKIMGS